MRGLYASCFALLVALAAPAPAARAYHTDRYRVVPGTAFTLHRGEAQVGLFRAEYAVLETLTLGAYVVPWLGLFPNLHAKLLLYRDDHWAVSLEPGVIYANFNWPHAVYGLGFQGTTLKAWVVPISASVTRVIRHRFMLTLGGSYNVITGNGAYDPQDFQGTAAATNAQIGLDFQWRLNQVVSLIWQGNLIAYQQASGAGTANVSIDSSTQARVKGEGTAVAFDASHGFSTSIATFLSWKSLNLRVGVGYGNFNIPGFNVVVPKLYPFPVFDLYWRWGDRHARVGDQEF